MWFNIPVKYPLLATVSLLTCVACSEVQPEGEQASEQAPEQAISQEPPAIVHEPVEQTGTVPEFAEYSDVRAMKESYFAFLLPMIEGEKAHLRQVRAYLQELETRYQEGEGELSESELAWLSDLAERYGIAQTQPLAEQLAELNLRVDVVPINLILMQSANETGWGRSRFARQARNFFGQWCWTSGCGLVPRARPEGQVYEVRKFDSVESSVRSYIHNLNTHFAYEELRARRAELREAGEPLTIANLGPGLQSYSERGQAYVDELLQMLRVNRPIIEEVAEELGAPEELATTPETTDE